MFGNTRRSTLLAAGIALAMVLLVTGFASACPTCKESLAHDPASANLARGIYYSILFMMSMPFLIFGSLCAYFYWEVCRAKARQAQEQLVAAGMNAAASGGLSMTPPADCNLAIGN